MTGSCNTYNLRSLITKPTCYKNPENPTCIDLILTNHPYSFQNSCVFEIGQSDFHKMTVSSDYNESIFSKTPTKNRKLETV